MATTPHINEVALSALAFGQPLWAPEEAEPRFGRSEDEHAPQTHPRGNGSVHEADLARGEEQMARVLGW